MLKILSGLVGIGIFFELAITLYSMVKNHVNQKERVFQQSKQKESLVFAEGICVEKLVWVFLVSALIGDIIETFYCRALEGVWMSRSSVLYGPFSIVWGIGAVVLTIVLSRFEHKSEGYIFCVGALIGGVYEYVCSVFTELVLGYVFWDYSWMPLNIGGRTNLLYMGFWGILSMVWIKFIYPFMSQWIEKIPVLQGKIITWILVGFMSFNTLLSAMAMIRYTERSAGIEASNPIEEFLDATYEDAYIEKVWPNMMVR